MTDERWPRVKALFQAALERSPDKRAAFLDAATGDDAALRHEVDSLLASDASGASFLDGLPVASQSVVLANPLAGSVLAAGLHVGPYEIGRAHV